MASYNQKILAFVLNLRNNSNLLNLKIELIEFFKTFETDDKSYLINRGKQSFERKGQFTAELANYITRDSFEYLLRDALQALEFEPSLEKVLFIFNDSGFDQYQISKLIKIARREGYELHFFDINREPLIEGARSLEDFQGLSVLLQDLYKKGGI